jgi:lipopolysaccharide transport system ATP-binding protein
MSSERDLALSVRGLCKSYTIDHQRGERHSTLAESLLARARRPFRRAERETFWALRDVSFDVSKGEVVGIIGRNGAGKSTLLKVLSRITEPTAGEVDAYGPVGSLLEVGTGFHPELTGRENIYLNGAILGMAKAEIRRQFDAIVDFAGVEKFLDTPVKRYSSGMYVRLAFAVAAHLRSDILIVDEVLAVGDAEFQDKCLGKMKDVSTDGRTVLFVSHNMSAIGALCRQVVHLDRGRTEGVCGDVRGTIARYLRAGADGGRSPSEWRNTGGAMDNPAFRPERFYVGDEDGGVTAMPVRGDATAYVYVEGTVRERDVALNVGYGLYDASGTLLYWSATTDTPRDQWPRVDEGRVVLRARLPYRLLNEGRYRVELLVSLYHRQWISCPGTNAPSVELSIQGGLSDSPYWMERRPGVLAPVCQWTLEQPHGEPAGQRPAAAAAAR